MTALLTIENLNLEIGGRTLIKNLAVEVGAGEVWCLLGPNGSGKTTLFHTVMGLREAQSGSIVLSGRVLTAWAPRELAKLRGFLPQIIHDAFGASVEECVMMGRHPHLNRWQWEGEHERDIAFAALSAVDLAGFANRDVLSLSGGERQRVALATLLAQETPLLLLDEPLAHLDLHHQIMVLSHLAGLARERNTGLLYSVHDLNLAVRFSTHAMVLGPQGAVSLGPVAEVMREDILSRAFGHRVTRIEHAGKTLFIPE
ncbi:MAG: ABC transporter ATP-binding protein [Burkholderiales bacterium]